ncbi:MAG: hypothetical protein P4N60_11235 [Verrucomicrobiae bacterium]|nr:hypothetical protein [Verrucomicrobiae bacterium]
MSEPVKIVVVATGVPEAVKQLETVAPAMDKISAATQQAATHTGHATGVFAENRMALMELEHSARAMADGLMAGINPLRMMAMEGPRLLQASSVMTDALRTQIMSFIPLVGGAAVGVGALVAMWKSLNAVQQENISRNNEITDSFQKQADAIKVITAAAKGGAITDQTREELLGQLGINLHTPTQVSLKPDLTPQTSGVNAFMAHTSGRGGVPLKELGLPDADAIDQVNQKLYEMGVMLKTVDPKTKVISYSVNPEIADLAALTTMREKYEAQMEVGFDKQRARAEKQHAEDLRNLDVEIAKAQQFREQLYLKLGQTHDPQEQSMIQSTMDQFSPEKMNDDRALLEEQYQSKLADIAAKEAAKRTQVADEEARKAAEFTTKAAEAAHKEMERQDKDLADAIEAYRIQSAGKNIQTYELEYNSRMTLAAQQLAGCIIDEDQYTDKVTSAAKERLASEKAYTAELQKQAQLKQEIARAETGAQLHAIQSNPMLTADQKAQQSIPLYQQQMAQNQQAITGLTGIASTTTDESARLEAQKQIADLMQKQVELKTQLDAAQGQNSFSYQMQSAMVSLQNMNNLAKETAGIFTGAFNTAIGSISKGITGLIMGTMSWAQALRQIASTILNQVIQSIVEMGVRMIATQLMTFLFGRGLATTGVAAAEAEAKILTAANTAPAALAAIASYGGAVAAAVPVWAIAAMGAAGFSEGGYTGDGGMFDPAGIVHRGEFVFNADAVNRIGVDNLDAMHRGAVAPAAAAGGSTAGGSGALPPKVVTVFDRQSLMAELKKPDYAHITIQHVLDNKSRLGFQT